MRIACLLLFSVFVLPAICSEINEIARQKRDDSCSSSCFVADKASSKSIDDAMPKNLTTCRWYTPDQVNALCKVKADAIKCFGKCPDDETKTLGMNVLNAIFVCEDRFKNFPSYYPCIEKSCGDVDKTCSASCQSQRGDADKLFSFFEMTKQILGSGPSPKKVLGDSCSYLSCYTRCANPIFTEKCGKATADLESAMIDRTVDSATDIIRALVGKDWVMPQECSVFSSGGCVALVPFTSLIALAIAAWIVL